jgi:1,4-dihydroxy-2-naphthoate polyprenyltransferase
MRFAGQRLWYFLKLTRPVFLLGGVLLYLLGALVAIVDGAVLHIGRLLAGQALVTAIQIMTHYANEYYDQYCDRLNDSRTWFSGGSGMLTLGVLSPETARRAALIAALCAFIALLVAGGQVPAVFFIGAASLVLAWSYSAPPLALSGSGWGELAASLIVAFMVPLVGNMMQTGGRITPALLMVCLPLILIHFAMLIAFQVPDWKSDQAAGKRTLSVRLGLQRATRLHNIVLLLACILTLGLAVYRWPGAYWAWLAVPLAGWQAYAISKVFSSTGGRRYLWLTMGAVGLFALSAMLWLTGFTLHWFRFD